jgi:DNA-binding NarL/FixJ family response regulator
MVKFWEFSSRNRQGHKPHPLVSLRREAVLIFWSHGWTEEAIAIKCGIDVDTVGRHLREARKAGDPRAEIRHAATRMALQGAE